MQPTTRARRLLALTVTAVLVLGACGDDDDETGGGDGGDEPTASEAADEGGRGDEPSDEADLAAYCDAVVAIETLPEPEIDFETASPEDIAAAYQAWARDSLRAKADDVLAVAPDELDADYAVLDAAVDEVIAGNVEAFDTPEVAAAEQRAHAFDLENCEFDSYDVTLADYSFGGIPDELPAGPASFELTNDGAEAHELVLVRKNDGVTETAEELLELPEEEVMGMVTFVGSPTVVAPGDADYVMAQLEPGDYVAVCFIPTGTTSLDGPPPTQDAPPHVAHGMVHEFTVT